jgi:hypothetical protein
LGDNAGIKHFAVRSQSQNLQLSFLRKDRMAKVFTKLLLKQYSVQGSLIDLLKMTLTFQNIRLKVFGNVTVDFYKDENQNVKHFTLNYGFLHLDFNKIK